MEPFICWDSQKLKQTIQERDLKMWWVAEMAGIHRSTLRRWLSGEITRVNTLRATRLMEVIGVGLVDVTRN